MFLWNFITIETYRKILHALEEKTKYVTIFNQKRKKRKKKPQTLSDWFRLLTIEARLLEESEMEPLLLGQDAKDKDNERRNGLCKDLKILYIKKTEQTE